MKQHLQLNFILGLIGGGLIGNLLPDFLRQAETLREGTDIDRHNLLFVWVLVCIVLLVSIGLHASSLQRLKYEL
jgi:ABC-type phosphate/phosphonate transport system permease subunit